MSSSLRFVKKLIVFYVFSFLNYKNFIFSLFISFHAVAIKLKNAAVSTFFQRFTRTCITVQFYSNASICQHLFARHQFLLGDKILHQHRSIIVLGKRNRLNIYGIVDLKCHRKEKSHHISQ